MRARCAFTLLELLVVIAILSLLVTLLLPALGKARDLTRTTICMANMRNMELAHAMYAASNKDRLIQAGLSHGGAHGHEEVAWVNTLRPYYGDLLLARCPSDKSPHWEDGIPVPPSADQYRQCSYGINEFTDVDLCPWGGPFTTMDDFRNPMATVHFVEMAETGEYAAADHPHVDLWIGNVLAKASAQLQIHRHGGAPRTWSAKANYSFLDGHAETLTFEEVFTDFSTNKFDPEVAW